VSIYEAEDPFSGSLRSISWMLAMVGVLLKICRAQLRSWSDKSGRLAIAHGDGEVSPYLTLL
jgi:hypothetical protein